MNLILSRQRVNGEFVRKVVELSGENIYACYQCGKCSSACPFVDKMDLLPSQVIRLVQFGDERVLNSGTIWVCSACFTCRAGCPKGIDIANINEALRLIHLRKNIDHVKLNKLKRTDLAGFPQIALISCLRKYSS